ncbi:hypothetical protein EDD17DRAFT_1091813 [Pisolithus thermaeus]|nr:hypothetical protein EV401DRAFT_189040 [Pisolithus croceorrhizus]KAI6154362.1 hypothetical protein EDD17DRAFT_1091813 [Pisolithus thermaeus]
MYSFSFLPRLSPRSNVVAGHQAWNLTSRNPERTLRTFTAPSYVKTGPPGIGKSTFAHLCAKAEGYTPIEMNASDTRRRNEHQ